MPSQSAGEPVPEAWRLYLTPRVEIVCLKINRMISHLSPQLDAAVKIGDRLVLMGYQSVDEADPDTLVQISTGDEHCAVDPRGVWNFYVDVPIPPT